MKVFSDVRKAAGPIQEFIQGNKYRLRSPTFVKTKDDVGSLNCSHVCKNSSSPVNFNTAICD